MRLKRLLSMLLVCMLMLTLIPATAYASEGEDDQSCDMIGHDYVLTEVIRKPDCQNSGMEKYVCSRCGEEELRYPLPLDHEYEFTETVAPTCTVPGYDLYTCRNCGATDRDNFVTSLGHDTYSYYLYPEETVPPTCTESGWSRYVCSVCGAERTEENTPLGHNFSGGTVVKYPTAEEEGEVEFRCTFCDATERRTLQRIPDENSQIRILGAHWFMHTPNAGWDMGPDDCHYETYVIASDGGFICYSKRYYSTSEDAKIYVENHGLDKSYYFIVECYDEDNNLIAYGQSDTISFYKVTVNKHTVDADDNPIEEDGGYVFYGVDGMSQNADVYPTSLFGNATAEIDVNPETGFIIAGCTVNGGEPKTDSHYEFELTEDTVIDVTFKKSDAMSGVTVYVGDGHDDIAQQLCEFLLEEEPDCGAVASGSTVTFATMQAQVINSVYSLVREFLYDLSYSMPADTQIVPINIGFKASYSDEDEYMNDMMDKLYMPMPEQLSLYFMWVTRVPTLDITLDSLLCGTELQFSMDPEDESPVQTGAPEAHLDPDVGEAFVYVLQKPDESSTGTPVDYEPGMPGEAVVIRPDTRMPYSGTVTGGEVYTAMIGVRSSLDYLIDRDTVITVNGQQVENMMGTLSLDITVEHDYNENGICRGCGDGLPMPEPEPEFKTHSLVLADQIGVNFFMDLSCLTDDEKQASYVEFTVKEKTLKVPYNASFRDEITGDYYGFTCYVNSIEMADTITAAYHYGDGDVVTQKYAVLDYLDYFDKNQSEFPEKAQYLIKALADYGYYSQIYLSEANDWTIGDEHAEMPIHYADAFNFAGIKEEVAKYAPFKDIENSNITKVSFKLKLDSATAMCVYLTPSSGKVTASASFNGKTFTAKKQKDGRYLITIDGIFAHVLGDAIEINGTAGGEFFCQASPMSYVWGVLNSDLSTDAKNCMSALYCYYETARAYIGG